MRTKLLTISPATIDQILQKEKRTPSDSSRSLTKPGTLLKHQIPIRTFADWEKEHPGFCETDLVAHDGGNPSGDFYQTLNVTDIHTGWTEIQAIQNKAQKWFFEALREIWKRLPFPLLGIDSDNGGEFINSKPWRYCQEEATTSTRSQPFQKNDNCYGEEKHWTMVRITVGYSRYETEGELLLLNQLSILLGLYTNFFQPLTRLIGKERLQSRSKSTMILPKLPFSG